jgi:hypothetical protein
MCRMLNKKDIWLNSGSDFITSYVIGSPVPTLVSSVKCDLFNFHNSNVISTLIRCQTCFSTRNSLLHNFNRNYNVHSRLLGIPVRNQTHLIVTSYVILLILYYYYYTIIMASTVSTLTAIYTARSCVQILAAATALILSQNIQTNPITHLASKSIKTRFFLWQ